MLVSLLQERLWPLLLFQRESSPQHLSFTFTHLFTQEASVLAVLGPRVALTLGLYLGRLLANKPIQRRLLRGAQQDLARPRLKVTGPWREDQEGTQAPQCYRLYQHQAPEKTLRGNQFLTW